MECAIPATAGAIWFRAWGSPLCAITPSSGAVPVVGVPRPRPEGPVLPAGLRPAAAGAAVLLEAAASEAALAEAGVPLAEAAASAGAPAAAGAPSAEAAASAGASAAAGAAGAEGSAEAGAAAAAASAEVEADGAEPFLKTQRHGCTNLVLPCRFIFPKVPASLIQTRYRPVPGRDCAWSRSPRTTRRRRPPAAVPGNPPGLPSRCTAPDPPACRGTV